MDDGPVPGQTLIKKLLHLIGIGLTLVSVAFLGIALFRQFDAIRDMQWEVAGFLAVVAATVLFLISYLLLAMSWALMLEDETRHRRELVWAVSIYARTSILKYVPGNVFHFIGRNMAGHRLDRGHFRLALASAFEIGLSLLSALLLASITFLIVPAPFPQMLFYASASVTLTAALILLFKPRLASAFSLRNLGLSLLIRRLC